MLVVISDFEATDGDEGHIGELHHRERNNRLTVIPMNLSSDYHKNKGDSFSLTFDARPFSQQTILELYLFIKNHVARFNDAHKQRS